VDGQRAAVHLAGHCAHVHNGGVGGAAGAGCSLAAGQCAHAQHGNKFSAVLQTCSWQGVLVSRAKNRRIFQLQTPWYITAPSNSLALPLSGPSLPVVCFCVQVPFTAPAFNDVDLSNYLQPRDAGYVVVLYLWLLVRFRRRLCGRARLGVQSTQSCHPPCCAWPGGGSMTQLGQLPSQLGRAGPAHHPWCCPCVS